MTSDELLAALRRLRVETGSLACLGCGHEHICGDHGCVILRETADLIERLEKEKAALLEYAKKNAGCAQCANYRHQCDVVDCFQCTEDCPCKKCKKGRKWEWKGLEDERKDAG